MRNINLGDTVVIQDTTILAVKRNDKYILFIDDKKRGTYKKLQSINKIVNVLGVNYKE